MARDHRDVGFRIAIPQCSIMDNILRATRNILFMVVLNIDTDENDTSIVVIDKLVSVSPTTTGLPGLMTLKQLGVAFAQSV